MEINKKKTGSGRALDTDWTDAKGANTAGDKEPIQRMSLEIPISVHTEAMVGAKRRRSSFKAEAVEMFKARNGMAPWPAEIVDQVLRQVTAAVDAGEMTWPEAAVDSAVHQWNTEQGSESGK